ncbi:MAG: plasmid pRiA4b ORF-3 family protein [Streptosporangiaceae bacterium]
MANRHRPASGKPARHLAAVPDDPQPPLWDIAELSRLAYLRRLANETGQPAEAIRLIETAATADDALASLVAAGLMPGGAQSLDDLLSWFAPLLEPGCDQITAEIAASQLVAEMRRSAPAGTDVAEPLLTVIADAADDRRDEAVAMLRALGAVGPAEVRSAASAAAARMVAAGQPDVPWAGLLGTPQPGRCFGYEDIHGEQRSVVVTFSYGSTRHALVTLIDCVLGGVKDLYVCDYSDRWRAQYRAAGQQPDTRYRDLDRAAARALLDDALARPACPVERGQAENVATYLELLRARVALLPAARPARPERRATASRTRSSRNIHRLKVTLRGSKPPIWRRFEVPSDISLQRLHSVIQVGFGWQDCHLHVFETVAGHYGTRDPDLEYIRSDASKRLSAVADWPGDHVGYEYDFGDGWRHVVTVEAVQAAEPGVAYPCCTAGKRACPPEDCGGLTGYYQMLAVLADPGQEDHRAMLEWLGIPSAAEFDPDYVDLDAVNDGLSGIARVLVRT